LKHHYETVEAASGKEGLEQAFREQPDVILLDIMMPGVDGYQVCSALRANPRTADLVILMLTNLSGVSAREKALEVGADDFITKGEPLGHLDGRIKTLIKQRILARAHSWLADLDGSVATDNVLRARLASGSPSAICYLDLNGLGAFDERAGYEAGERVLWQLARILRDQVRSEDGADYVGYYGADDFVVLTTPDRGEALARSIVEAFDRVAREWSGWTQPGEGVPSLSAGVVVVEGGHPVHPGQVSQLGRTLLRQAKAEVKSAVRVGRL